MSVLLLALVFTLVVFVTALVAAHLLVKTHTHVGPRLPADGPEADRTDLPGR
jgi:hypothetical protein